MRRPRGEHTDRQPNYKRNNFMSLGEGVLIPCDEKCHVKSPNNLS